MNLGKRREESVGVTGPRAEKTIGNEAVGKGCSEKTKQNYAEGSSARVSKLKHEKRLLNLLGEES